MKFLVRWVFRLVLLTLLLAIALLICKDLLAREIIESVIAAATGLECRISSAEVRLLSPTLLIGNLRLYHPASLGGGQMIRVTEALLEYEPLAIPKAQIQLRLLRLDVQELTIVDQSPTNSTLQILKKVWTDIPTQISNPWLQFAGVKTLNLNIDKVTYLRGPPPTPPVHLDIRLRNQLFSNLKTTIDFQNALEQLLTPIIMHLATNPPPKPPNQAAQTFTR